MLNYFSIPKLILYPISPSQLTVRSLKYVSKLILDEEQPSLLLKLKHMKIVLSCTAKLQPRLILKIFSILSHSQHKMLRGFSTRSDSLSKFLFFKFANIRFLDVNCADRFSQILFARLRKLNFLSLKSGNENFIRRKGGTILRPFLTARFQSDLMKNANLKKIKISGPLDSNLLHIFKVLDNSLPVLKSLNSISLDIQQNTHFADAVCNHGYLSKLDSFCYSSSTNSSFLNNLIKYTPELMRLTTLSILLNKLSPKDLQFFRKLRDLPSLRDLQFSIEDSSRATPETLSCFLDSFSLPQKLEKLDLSFEFIDWEIFFDYLKTYPEAEEIMTSFFATWDNLTDLKSLKFRFEISNTSINLVSQTFLANILKRMTSLDSLFISFERYLHEDEVTTQLEPIDTQTLNLQNSFKALKNLAPTLRQVYIEAPWIEIGCFSVLKLFALTDLEIKGLIIDPLDFDTLKYLMSTDQSINPILKVRDLFIQDEEMHTAVLERFEWFSKRITGAISITAKESMKIDIIDSLEHFLKTFKKQKEISLEYRFGEVENLHLKYIEYFLKTNQAFKEFQLTGDDRIYRYSRTNGKVINLTFPVEDAEIYTPQQNDVTDYDSADEDEGLSFFLGDNHMAGDDFDPSDEEGL